MFTEIQPYMGAWPPLRGEIEFMQMWHGFGGVYAYVDKIVALMPREIGAMFTRLDLQREWE